MSNNVNFARDFCSFKAKHNDSLMFAVGQRIEQVIYKNNKTPEISKLPQTCIECNGRQFEHSL